MANLHTLSLVGGTDQDPSGVLRLYGEEQAEVRNERQIQRDSAFFSVATNRDLGETRQYVEDNWDSVLIGEAEGRANTAITGVTNRALDLEDEEAGEVIATTIEELRQIETLRRFLPESMAAAVRANVTGARGMALDRIARLHYAGERFQEELESMGINGETALDFSELLVDPFSAFHEMRFRNLTERFEQLLRPGVTEDHFEQGLEEIITEALDTGLLSNENKFYFAAFLDTGLLSNENKFYFAAFLDTLGSGVYSNQSAANMYLGWLDLGLTAGLDVIGPAIAVNRARTAARGTTALSTGVVPRGASMAPQDAARSTGHALSTLPPSARRNDTLTEHIGASIVLDDPTTLEAARHTHTGVMTPTIMRAGIYSAPEHEGARIFELNSRAFDIFRRAAADVSDSTANVFDETAYNAFRTRYVQDRLAFLRASGATRIHDVDVGVDAFGNMFSIEYYGKVDGTGYATRTTAQRAAGFGDEPVQMPDGTWSVARRVNIDPADLDDLVDLGYTGPLEQMMLWRATDPSQLGDGFWARWGSPAAQTDPDTGGAYLYRAESIFERTIRDINRDTKRIRRTMRLARQNEVYHMFEQMAGLERRNAYTRAEFEREFAKLYNRAPSENQTRLYMLEQERLDAEAFVNADIVYRRAVEMDALALRVGDFTYIARRRDNLPEGTMVYDPFENGGSLRRSREGDVIYENMSSTDLPAEALYIVANEVETRAVRHSDFLFRNAGGHRAYSVNSMQFLVKQPVTRTYAGGVTREENPRTLLGARTSDEAKTAVEEINTIIDEFSSAVPTRDRNADDYLDSLLAARTPQLDAVVAAFNRWNPAIENVQDLVDFARARSIDLRTKFRVVAEGEPLDDMAMISDRSLFVPPGASHSEAVRMELAMSGRGTLPLHQYGGGTVPTRGVEETLHGSYAATVARLTENAYRLRAGQGLIKAALTSGVMKRDYNKIRHLPLRTQLQRIRDDGLIDISGATGSADNIGRRLQLDLDRLLFRLDQTSPTTRIWNNMVRSMANFLYGTKFPGHKNLAQWMDRRSTDPITALRGLAFDAYLGMGNVSQLLMQSVQVVNIVGIAGLRGVAGAALYPVMRFAYANGNPNVIRRTGQLMESVTGLKADQFVDMVDMFSTSGRGIVHSLAELSNYEDAASNVGRFSTRPAIDAVAKGVRQVRELGRIPFKEGDLVARITAFNTAYMEAVAKYGSRTDANRAAFTRFVAHREQVLTQNMTSASRQGYEHLPFMQFMTYQLRINEAIFAGTLGKTKAVLTWPERMRLATVHFAMFGMMATTGTSLLAQWLMYNNDMEADPAIVRMFYRGGLDALLSWVTDSETAAAQRFSSSGGMYNIMRTLSEDRWWEILVGPSGTLSVEMGDSMLGVITEGLGRIATGNPYGLETELTDFVRIASSTNYAYNAMTALRYGEYRTRNGLVVTDELTDISDAVFLAFGIPLEEVSGIYEFIGQNRLHRGWLESHADSITQSWRRAHEAIREGDREQAVYWYRVLADQYGMLTPRERETVDRLVDNDAQTLSDRIMIDIFQQHSEYLDMVNR